VLRAEFTQDRRELLFLEREKNIKGNIFKEGIIVIL
jgi:hypothetical protein